MLTVGPGEIVGLELGAGETEGAGDIVGADVVPATVGLGARLSVVGLELRVGAGDCVGSWVCIEFPESTGAIVVTTAVGNTVRGPPGIVGP